MKASVIVPVWNSREYIPDCIRSLREQTFRDFETIFVVDSKTDDGSEELLSGLEDINAKVIIQQDDGRVGYARNLGVQEASGEYIWFLDVDDIPDPEFLEAMLGIAESTGADVTACNFVYHCPGTDMPDLGRTYHTREYSGIDALISMNEGGISPNVWDKLFRTSIIKENGIRFEKGFSEDYHFMSEACIRSSKVVYTTRPLYVYNINDGSRSYNNGNDIAAKDVEIFEHYRNIIGSDHPEYMKRFCRASMAHLIHSFTMMDWEACRQIKGRDSIASSLRYCSPTKLEFLIFRVSPRIYHKIGTYMRSRRYNNKSFLFDKKLRSGISSSSF